MLTPFAVVFRYDALPQESEETLDKAGIRQNTHRLRIAARQEIRNSVPYLLT